MFFFWKKLKICHFLIGLTESKTCDSESCFYGKIAVKNVNKNQFCLTKIGELTEYHPKWVVNLLLILMCQTRQIPNQIDFEIGDVILI